VRPEETGPHISVKQPRGSPPVSASISHTPLETISGTGRTVSREAGVTSANLGNADRRSKTRAGEFEATEATGRRTASVGKSGKDDMERTSNFQGTSGQDCPEAMYIRFLFA